MEPPLYGEKRSRRSMKNVMPAQQKHRYRVSGTDDLGDVHIFLTDDGERAEGVAEIMREDLEDVAVTDTLTGRN
jgi:hypothetical protein